MTRARRYLPFVVLLVLAQALAWTPTVTGQEGLDLSGTPQAECGPGSDPEGDVQGRVPAADYDSGRTDRPYTCNTELVAHEGTSGGFKVHRYVDADGTECAYYDSTLVFPRDLLQRPTEGSGVIVLDMTDPTAPVRTAELVTPAMLSPHESLEISHQRGILVAVTGNPAVYPGIVDVYDISQDCTQPVLQASAPVGFVGHEAGLSPDGMTFYSASAYGDSIVAVDLTDLRTPTPIAFLPVQSHGIEVSDEGDRLYITPVDVGDLDPGPPVLVENPPGGLAILDVTAIRDREPLAGPEFVSSLTWPEVSIPQTAIPVEIDGVPHLVEIDEFVSFADIAAPINGTPGAGRLIDISDETAPEVVGTFRLDVHDPVVRRSGIGLEDDPGFSFGQGYAGHYCAVPQRVDPGIVACSMIASGLRVFDIRDPASPVEIAYFNTVGEEGNAPYAMSAPAFVPERGEIWYADAASGFHVVRLTNDVWPFEEPQLERLAGPGRVQTAVAVSRETFPDGGATAAVLARADDFPDALAGGPLAVAVDGPLLLSGRDAVATATMDELRRVLPDGATVYLLGGEQAVSSAVETTLRAAGFAVVRYGGATRFETAEIIAREGLGSPATVVVADGGSFADAVVAAPVAGLRGAALLLSDGDVLTSGTATQIGSREVVAVGPAAVAAVPAASVGLDGRATGSVATDVAQRFFADPRLVGFARSDDFPDALTAGALLGRTGRGGPGPLLLVDPNGPSPALASYLSGVAPSVNRALVLGGPAAISEPAVAQLQAALRR